MPRTSTDKTVIYFQADRALAERVNALVAPLSLKLGVNLDRAKVLRLMIGEKLKELEAEFSLTVGR